MSISGKKLELIIQPKVIDHLGIKMYQKPVDVISELIANTWDADAEEVQVTIEENNVIVQDKGLGMTFKDCQDKYLVVGRNRREEMKKDLSETKRRPLLGRKGIGKFSGFGIAETIRVDTISKENGEHTVFEMDLKSLHEHDAKGQTNKPINLKAYEFASNDRKKNAGTSVELAGLNVRGIDLGVLKDELSRRFLLPQLCSDFIIKVNGIELPDGFAASLEFSFPNDLTDKEKERLEPMTVSSGWAIEKFQDKEIKWRIGFFENTIQNEELRGLAIFARGKIAQKPFFFDLTGGISGQNAIEYMTGQIQMDFIDEGGQDLIATERQRINLQTLLGKEIKKWGIEKIKKLTSFWKVRRTEERIRILEDRLSGFNDRLMMLPSSERRTVKSVLKKIAGFPRLGQARFHDWCNDILTSWESGRLRKLISEMADSNDLDETQLLEILAEAQVLTALNIAEAIKTKITAVGKLKEMIKAKDLENSVRDYIYKNPWMIHPKWEQFIKERSINKIIKDAGDKFLKSKDFAGRVDMVLAAGNQLLLLEFMRPGLEIDLDHLDRINHYIVAISDQLKSQTGREIKVLETVYMVADKVKDSSVIRSRIAQLKNQNILFLTWDGLVEQAIKQWEEHLEILKKRNPEDSRLQDL